MGEADAGQPAAPWLRFELKTELELELVDVEGEGGFSNQDTTRLKIDNRSPYFQIDFFALRPRVWFKDLVELWAELRFETGGAEVDRVVLATRWLHPTPWLGFRLELGRNTPIVRYKRRTESYPLLAKAFHRGREHHLVGEGRLLLGPVSVELSGVVASKRPLGNESPGEDDSLYLLAYADERALVGSNFTWGGKLTAAVAGFSATVYGFGGELIDNHDTQLLDQALSGYSDLGDRADRTHYWFGARLAFERWGLHVFAEALRAQDGLLPREAWFVQASYEIPMGWAPFWFSGIEPIAHYGHLNVLRLEANPDEPLSWDRRMLAIGLLLRFTEFLTLKGEYYFLDETTGGPDLMRDNQLLIQLNVDVDDVIRYVRLLPVDKLFK